jgi:tetratricopeptide (TPR) repeat protein
MLSVLARLLYGTLNRYDPSMVFFVDATTSVALEQDYALIAKAKGVGSSAKEAINWLSNTDQPSFILMDNADNPKIDFRDYMPHSTNAHVLMTTRLQHAGRDYATNDASIDLGCLSLDEAEELLIRTAALAANCREGVEVLVQELHCHALAVAQAGAGISSLQLTVLQYTDHFRRYRTKLMNGTMDGVVKRSLDGYPEYVASTFFVNYHELPASSRDLFNLCGYLHHTGIVEEIFRRAYVGLKSYQPMLPLSQDEETALASVTQTLHSFTSSDHSKSFDTLAFRRCIHHVLSLSLIRYDESTSVYFIHPLVHDSLQTIVIDYLPTSFLLTLAVKADVADDVFKYRAALHVDRVIRLLQEKDASLLDSFHPDIGVTFGTVLTTSGMWYHAERLQWNAMDRVISALGGAHEDSHRIANGWARTLSLMGHTSEAEQIQRTIVLGCQKHGGEDHPHTLASMSNLASTLGLLGRFSEAERIESEVLEKRRRVLGEDHPDTLMSIGNLAKTLHSLGRLNAALKMEAELLQKHIRILGEDHPDTLTTMNNLALTLRSLGRLDEAEKMGLELVEKQKRIVGEDHPGTLTSMDNLASTLQSLARWNEAEEMYMKVLNKKRRLLGEGHPDTLATLNNLAVTLKLLGRFDEAEKIGVELLEKARRVYGEDHPHILRTMSNLASTLHSLRRYKEAEETAVEVLEKARRVLGEDHPDTLTLMGNLTTFLHSLRRHKEALKMEMELLEKQRRILGEDHPNTLTTMNNLALTLESLGRLDEAEKMGLELVEKRKRKLGEDHPDTLTSIGNLTAILHSLSRFEEAEKMGVELIEKQRCILGEDHPDTHTSMANLAFTLQALGRKEEAKRILESLVEKWRRVPGAEHPYIQATLHLIQSLSVDSSTNQNEQPIGSDPVLTTEEPAATQIAPENTAQTVSPPQSLTDRITPTKSKGLKKFTSTMKRIFRSR